MQIVTFKSDEARKRWRDMMDAALVGKDVVIERYDKPQAVLVNYEQWQKEKARLRELELAAEARRIKGMIDGGKMSTISHEELVKLIMEKRAHAMGD